MYKQKIWIGVLLLATGMAGFFVGVKVSTREYSALKISDTTDVVNNQIRTGGYTFINPLVDCDCAKPSKKFASVLLEDRLREYISVARKTNKATHISVYFRDLNNGPWIGIEEDEQFKAASLLKVPLMIAVLKKAETDPLFLHKQLTYYTALEEPFFKSNSDTGRLEQGKSYEVEYLLTRMIAYSDNQARNLLWAEIGRPLFDKVMSDIQINVSGVRTSDDLISVKDYSSFFRILYNASYLNKELSEKALYILSLSTFSEGLLAGLPIDIKVANKFGELGLQKDDELQLHDCGIVYCPPMPYLLCVMTKGKKREDLPKIISHISSIVYETVATD